MASTVFPSMANRWLSLPTKSYILLEVTGTLQLNVPFSLLTLIISTFYAI
jgi:hypothetical protein